MKLTDQEEKALAEACTRLAAGDFAFIDGGCGTGGSLEFCEAVFGKGRGVGFDSSPAKIEGAKANGYSSYRGNLASIGLPAHSVSFVSFLDVLEHLPDIATTRKILLNMAETARDFIFIRHPSFEDIEYLSEYGLKLGWTDWHGHPNMMTLADYDELFHELGWSAPTVFGQKPIASSFHPAIVPASAPTDTVEYDPALHTEKPEIHFDRVVFSQFDIFVRLNLDLPEEEWREVTNHAINRVNGTTRLNGLGVVHTQHTTSPPPRSRLRAEVARLARRLRLRRSSSR